MSHVDKGTLMDWIKERGGRDELIAVGAFAWCLGGSGRRLVFVLGLRLGLGCKEED